MRRPSKVLPGDQARCALDEFISSLSGDPINLRSIDSGLKVNELATQR
jgi:hypothetical protein